MMKEEQVARLLHRYMEATATAAEEEQLRQYFASGNYDARFEAYAPLFAAWPSADSALSSEEQEEILALCPPPSPQTSQLVHRWWRYAAVWLFGILLGVVGKDLLLEEQASSQLFQENRTARATADTVYHERVIVMRDTVYRTVAKLPTAPPARIGSRPSPALSQQEQSGCQPVQPVDDVDAAREAEKETQREMPAPPARIPWEGTGNVASLAVR
ncbi:MAG: hypothetical protein ACI3YD_06650 [Alloprevotella sp.]